ncbi:hypothetical protein MKZ38_000229 [Zalerion maritima]|uniref:Glycoprotease family protein n=1 Tax=Zalerion maritima TaxID=339359 RepID=A0AAD5RFM3_9PEZI|nr:hypothetical protein MKZ38_000229 [Zalerion maritima]
MAGYGIPSSKPQTSSPLRPKQYDDWEDWESDSETNIGDGKTYQAKEGIVIALTPDTPSQLPGVAYSGTVTTTVASQARQSMQRIKRLKSKHRQKAQNARAGIKVVTDMSQLQQQRQRQVQPHYAQGKFVDAAALRALEGSPNSASVGNWNWLKRKASKKHARKPSTKSIKTPITGGTDLSPNPAPIMIGISIPSEQVSDRENTPQTATAETPIDIARYLPPTGANTGNGNTGPQKSVWSPDTPSTAFESPGRSSSIYSQATNFGPLRVPDASVPPVPMVPENFRGQQSMPADQTKSPDAETPYTPFEEDTLSSWSASTTKSPAVAATGKKGVYRSGWWDHVTSPFAPSPQSGEQSAVGQSYNPFKGFVSVATTQSQQAQSAGTKDGPNANERWSGKGNKKVVPAPLTSPVHIMPIVPSIHTVSPIFPPNEEGKNIAQQQPKAINMNIGITVASSSPAPTTRSVSPASTASRPAAVASSSSSMSNNPFAQQAGAGSQQPQTQSEKARILEQENAASEAHFHEHPPPYSYIPPTHQVATAKYAGTPPPALNLNPQALPSPGIVSPAMTGTMTSQGAIGLQDVMLTPPPPGMVVAGDVGNVPDLPNRPPGSFVPGDHFQDARGGTNKVERQRRRHEREDAAARKAGGFWRGRGCIPDGGCYGRSGREGRKKRRIMCLLIIAVLILIITLAISLPLTLITRSSEAEVEVDSIWLNLTDFPPMPTGILTIAGPDKDTEASSCVNPPTMWSCYLPKEDEAKAEPFGRDQPKIIFQVQFDNSSTEEWDTPNGEPPTTTPGGAAVEAGDGLDDTLDKANQTGNADGSDDSDDDTDETTPEDILDGGLSGITDKVKKRFSRLLARTLLGDQATRVQKRADSLFTPSPEPPTFQEMWFLGNTTDGIVDDNKAGEPTPFYITILSSVDEIIGPNVLAKRQDSDDENGNPLSDGDLSSIGGGIDSSQNQTGDDDGSGLDTGVTVNLTAILPPPELNADGTGSKARMLPKPVQQPIRLYDRGLTTEHYGFYTYFNRTIYLQSTETVPDTNRQLVEVDEEGGSLESEAEKLVTFTETRFFVKIWTRKENETELVDTEGLQADGRAVYESEALTTTPGTFPYPVTFGTDTHGGNRTRKLAWFYRVDDDQHINRTDPKLILNDIGFGGTWINPRGSDNSSELLGGFDGGTGGCKCVWKNFRAANN